MEFLDKMKRQVNSSRNSFKKVPNSEKPFAKILDLQNQNLANKPAEVRTLSLSTNLLHLQNLVVVGQSGRTNSKQR